MHACVVYMEGGKTPGKCEVLYFFNFLLHIVAKVLLLDQTALEQHKPLLLYAALGTP